MGRWAAWNGFLAACGSCGRYHGKSWSPKTVLLASIALLEVSFFFTMRPAAAAATAASLVLASLAGLRTADLIQSDTVELLSFGVLLLGPLLINALILIRHQSRLGQRVA